jgi:hypothetical protein
MFQWLRRLLGRPTERSSSPVAASARVPISTDFWSAVQSHQLAQGDLLQNCFVPVFPPDFGTTLSPQEVPVATANLIVVTQSCDLENRKVQLVALCPIHSLAEFETASPDFAKKGKWEEVRQGRREGLYLLPSPSAPENNREALVVDFRQIVSLPFAYLRRHAEQLGPRWRLQSPYLEHFSQAFARFFMRVGLPSAIPPFK